MELPPYTDLPHYLRKHYFENYISKIVYSTFGKLPILALHPIYYTATPMATNKTITIHYFIMNNCILILKSTSLYTTINIELFTCNPGSVKGNGRTLLCSALKWIKDTYILDKEVDPIINLHAYPDISREKSSTFASGNNALTSLVNYYKRYGFTLKHKSADDMTATLSTVLSTCSTEGGTRKNSRRTRYKHRSTRKYSVSIYPILK